MGRFVESLAELEHAAASTVLSTEQRQDAPSAPAEGAMMDFNLNESTAEPATQEPARRSYFAPASAPAGASGS